MVVRNRRISKHDNPNNKLVFRNWRKDLAEILDKMPRGQECVVIECTNKAANRNAFLCTSCGIKYYDIQKTVISVTDKYKVQYNWLKYHVLAEDPE